MKKQILDKPFQDSFNDFLEKGETVLWRGSPSLKVPTKPPSEEEGAVIYLAIIVGTTLFFFGLALYPILIVVALVLAIFGSYFVYLKNNQKHHINYVITSEQILFQLPKKWNRGTVFHAIPISNIQNAEVTLEENHDDVGVVFLKIHRSKLVTFYTRNLKYGNKRYLPTLELIEHPHKVAKLIKKHIQENNI